ncbi:hypothetical protein ACFW9O_22745 [Streptomyces sp. NPDC059499]|uniref:hypothetical protein n=1 Tax=Streptomyces sp. NPDC059499 TaxID=3346852 RepID=UPI0036CC8095
MVRATEYAVGATPADTVSGCAALGRDGLREPARTGIGGYFWSSLNFEVDQK